MDDTELATVTTPALTSVSLGSAERGRIAADLLLQRLRDPDRPIQRATVQPRLHVRDSTTSTTGDDT
jgi:LacI family transcriptional regulator